MKFFHGGIKGLRRGDMILPPEQTGAPSLARFDSRDFCRQDRAYITTDKATAIIYAACLPKPGAVYEVEPIGVVEPDPDCKMSGLSFMCPKARVLSRHKVRGKDIKNIRKWLLQ